MGIRQRRPVVDDRGERIAHVDDLDLVIQAALDGAGLALGGGRPRHATPRRTGALVRVLEDWRPPVPRILPLLSESEAAAGGLVAVNRGVSFVEDW